MRAGKIIDDFELGRMATERPDIAWLHEHDAVGTFITVLIKQSLQKMMVWKSRH